MSTTQLPGVGTSHAKTTEPPTTAFPEDGVGGKGGGVRKITDNKGIIMTGNGGMGGVGGRGGDGGQIGDVSGNSGTIMGGDGGNAAQADGRGGPRTISPGERLNLPTAMWPYGYGGRGGNAPEYDRRLQLLTQIRQEFLRAFPQDKIFIDAGIDQVPVSWVNKRLEEMRETWSVHMGEGGYVMPSLQR